MKVLGIETATELVGVGLADDSGPRAELWATGRRRHAETLAPALAHVLEAAGWTMSDVDVLAVDVGPGLFTGLRVGVATAQGLGLALGLRIIGISSLEVLAHAGRQGGWPGAVVSVVDARRGEVFASAVRGDGRLVLGPAVFAPASLGAALEALDAGPLLAVGDGALRYGGLLRGVGGLVVGGRSLAGPPPGSLVSLALGRLAEGQEALTPELIVPDYLREADARINWTVRTPGGAP